MHIASYDKIKLLSLSLQHTKEIFEKMHNILTKTIEARYYFSTNFFDIHLTEFTIMLQSNNVRDKLILFAEEPRTRACLKASVLLNSGQWTVDSGQWTVDSGQWTVDSGQWTVDSGQWTACFQFFTKF